MSRPLVLDSAGLDALARRDPPTMLRALLTEALARDRNVLVPAVVCAEVCRGVARTRAVESALGRHDAAKGQRPAVAVVPTDLALAMRVGMILHGADADSSDLVDAHVVAACIDAGGGLIVTSDAQDIARLAAAVPGVRIVTRDPHAPRRRLDAG